MAAARAFLGELLGLLDPGRRALAVLVALRHLPAADDAEDASTALVSAELLLDAAELMLVRGLAVPETIERTVRRLASAEAGADPAFTPELLARATALASRLDAPARLDRSPAEVGGDLEVTLQGGPWVRELDESLGENAIRLPPRAGPDRGGLPVADGARRRARRGAARRGVRRRPRAGRPRDRLASRPADRVDAQRWRRGRSPPGPE